ncbi:MAG: ABC transporter substrate-binding protein [Bacteroidales bacterium]|jgi:iron complex transport system substrate-binding protein
MKSIIALLPYLIILSGCFSRNSSEFFQSRADSLSFTEQDIRYAEGFTIQTAENCKYITVFNPWSPPDTLATYVISSDTIVPAPCDFYVITPVERVACLSSTTIAMINLIGEGQKISACSDAGLIYDSVLYRRFLEGSLTDLGNTHLINAEVIVDHSPDLVMKYIYGSIEMVDEKLIDAGLQVAFNLELMEDHPLGRAEWIKFVAAFFNKSELADSIFEQLETEYLRLTELTSKQKLRPAVIDGSSYKGVWYAAGGSSYPAKMYADAGADYYWKTDTNRGSIPVSFETIIDKQAEADYWFGPSTGDRNELLKIDDRYTRLKAFREGNVYFFGRRVNPNGGLDYFESGVTRPDIILKDLISVFHPDLTDPDYEPVYLKKME